MTYAQIKALSLLLGTAIQAAAALRMSGYVVTAGALESNIELVKSRFPEVI